MSEQPRLKRDWIGRKIRTIRPLSNASGTIAVGTTLTVDGYYRGLICRGTSSSGEPIHITRVPEWFVELLTQEVSHGT